MNKIIYKIIPKKKVFIILDGKKEIAYYLPKRLAIIFIDYIQAGFYIDFVATQNIKKIGKIQAYEIAYFRKIEDRKEKKVYFDLTKLRENMFHVLEGYDYLLFLDFEMTMPSGKNDTFYPQIIQFGYVLTNSSGKTILKESNYLMPNKIIDYNYRTESFLKIEYRQFLKKAKPFNFFYDKFKDIFQKYDPQIIIWGINDYQVLVNNLSEKSLEIFFKRENFSNLLQLYRNYFQLGKDIGLFDAYKNTTNKNEFIYQRHNALDDAIMTKDVYFSFYKLIRENILTMS